MVSKTDGSAGYGSGRRNLVSIYLISLKDDVDRRKAILHSFPRNYHNMNVIDAVNGRVLTAESYYGYMSSYFADKRELISPSEIGCSLSHIHALELFLQSDSTHALVLEDDVSGSDDAIDEIVSIIAKLDLNSILICGGQEGLGSTRYVFGCSTHIKDVYKIPHTLFQHISRACAYVVTKKCAKLIVDRHKLCIELADNWEVFFRDGKTAMYFANLIHHPLNLEFSNIETERFLRRNPKHYRTIISSPALRLVFVRLRDRLSTMLFRLCGYKRII